MSERNWHIYIVHAKQEEKLAEKLEKDIREAGYEEIAHRGTVMVGEGYIAEASKALSTGGPVILCGTCKAMGSNWVELIVNAARDRTFDEPRIFCLQMEEDANVNRLNFGECIALYWQNPAKAIEDLIAALKKHYPLNTNIGKIHFMSYLFALALICCKISRHCFQLSLH
ncbi:hypothetical protein [Nostoc sp.]|uniref:hypothetical protein n=1 Tax=Nostoc sp. TaxID=1180 RepID=UPI002FF9465A